LQRPAPGSSISVSSKGPTTNRAFCFCYGRTNCVKSVLLYQLGIGHPADPRHPRGESGLFIFLFAVIPLRAHSSVHAGSGTGHYRQPCGCNRQLGPFTSSIGRAKYDSRPLILSCRLERAPLCLRPHVPCSRHLVRRPSRRSRNQHIVADRS
jgi:hypothetical protein